MKLFHSISGHETILSTDEAVSSSHEDIPKQALDTVVLHQQREVPMKKHQMIAGFFAVILVAAAATATAATMRPASSTQIAPTESLVLNELTVDVNKLPIEDFEDMSLVYSKHH